MKTHLKDTIHYLETQPELAKASYGGRIPSNELRQKNLRFKRNSAVSNQCASQGDNSIGNLGFNSFNFLTFMILTFNAIANVNNNINNNNNNNNDLSLNSISQTSQSTVSNSDNSNDIMVMILPMPGKKRKRSVKMMELDRQKELVALTIFHSILDVVHQLKFVNVECEGYIICASLKTFMKKVSLQDILLLQVLESSHQSPFLSAFNCERAFPYCATYKEI